MTAGAGRLGLTMHLHQLELGQLLDEGTTTTAVQWPRRAGKTTGCWSWLIGRCDLEPDTNIMVTAQTRQKARERWYDVKRMLDRHWPEEAGGPKIREGKGDEAFEFRNGSRLWIVAPESGSVRGDAVDVVYVDEPQELAPDVSLDIKQAVMPLFDTRPQGQVVLSGTPGKVRSGWYWEALSTGLAGRTGIVRGRYAKGTAVSVYAAQPDDAWDDDDVLLRVHPGIGTLTTLERILERREEASSALAFAMEYLGIWPGTDDSRAIDAGLWAAGAAEFAEKPRRFGLAFDVSPDSSTAALMAGWRDDDGIAHVEVLLHADPRAVGREAYRLWVKHKVPIAYDAIGANLEVAEMLARSKPKPKTTPMGTKDVVTAEAALVSALRAGELHHPDQKALNAAADGAAWRTLGDSGQLFGRRASAADITPIVGGSVALLAFDRLPKRAAVVVASVA
ncbi:phage terminase large subunit family protein [Jiangella sp. DSM 45060]|uniref:phage terminase large subunit family protein n=1 Tax=Jiangella sp. DSM 45060 TaxID=1798224 RepID=UPI0012FE53A1|nr:phage terminase large subunit family protein [Jiangella sp. DSM 45060]